MSEGILLYAEVNKSGYVQPVFFELACAAQGLSGKLNEPVCALIICAAGYTETVKEGFEKCGFDKVYAVEDERLAEYNTDLYAKAAVDLIKEIEPSIILIGATNQGRDLAPRIASTLKTGLTADCTDLDINENGQLAATRPTFGGKLMATILCKTYPQMASVRPKVFKPLKEDVIKNTEIIYKKPDIDGIEKCVELLSFIKSVHDSVNELEYAQVVVAGGAGMKTANGFEMLEKLAELLNGKVGATRAAADMGIAARDKQIGQTGLTVSPKLYIACGISGSVQHIVGMCDSDKIIAINNDPDAPIFETCDIGYVGDVFEVVPALIKHCYP
ncbi:MAG: electron transfer flavoprotein subunit alpha/FixB family protein [Heliobacteriaceae bacterium]|jgi:electron transfer flavoprotein alpha subunit|nr:electron transfer flavoprotein subunit alpha/FixB family protein [Heliobacteriaceae bacterium]